jgi:hypothetical protein
VREVQEHVQVEREVGRSVMVAATPPMTMNTTFPPASSSIAAGKP